MKVVFWKEKTAGLPNWGWGGIILGGAVVLSSWRRNKAAAEAEDDNATSSASGIELPGDVAPTYVFQNYDQDVTTVNNVPPGGGRPPTTPTEPKPPVVKPPVVKPPVVKPPVVTPPKGKWVTVTKWNAKNPPWNSTIWGIANKLLGPKVSWQNVWNAPQNAALKSKRKDPKKIQPGDKVWVPGAK